MIEQPMTIRCTLRLVLAEENVRRVREGRPSLSQRELAAETGIPPSVINALATDRNQRIDYKTLNRLCTYFKLQPGALFIWEPEEVERN